MNWWTDEDCARFQERADKLIAQYNDFEPRTMPGHHVNGALTVGENVGDLGGLTIALLAYRISLSGEEPPVIDGLTGPQRLLQSWAFIWRTKERPEVALQQLSVDPHASAWTVWLWRLPSYSGSVGSWVRCSFRSSVSVSVQPSGSVTAIQASALACRVYRCPKPSGTEPAAGRSIST